MHSIDTVTLVFVSTAALTFSVDGHVCSQCSIGIHQRPGDLEVNVCKTKALTNMRAASKDVKTGVITSIDMSLDACVEYLAADEILEVTPGLFRMSKNPDMSKKRTGRN